MTAVVHNPEASIPLEMRPIAVIPSDFLAERRLGAALQTDGRER